MAFDGRLRSRAARYFPVQTTSKGPHRSGPKGRRRSTDAFVAVEDQGGGDALLQ